MASSDMGSRPAQVVQYLGRSAAGVFEGVGQDGKPHGVQIAAGYLSLLVGGLGQGNHSGSEPGGIVREETEGVAGNITQQYCLSFQLFPKRQFVASPTRRWAAALLVSL